MIVDNIYKYCQWLCNCMQALNISVQNQQFIRRCLQDKDDTQRQQMKHWVDALCKETRANFDDFSSQWRFRLEHPILSKLMSHTIIIATLLFVKELPETILPKDPEKLKGVSITATKKAILALIGVLSAYIFHTQS